MHNKTIAQDVCICVGTSALSESTVVEAIARVRCVVLRAFQLRKEGEAYLMVVTVLVIHLPPR